MLLLYKKYGLTLTVLTLCLHVKAQRGDNISAFRYVNSTSYFHLYYDNDFFTKTDRYYSQGITAEYVHPRLKKNPLAQLLIKTGNSNRHFAISFNLSAYTPTSIKSDTILFGDRPYASTMSFKTIVVGVDSIRNHRIVSALSIGVIGPAAGGEQIQTSIHRWLNNKLPKGWQNQVQNDILLNYQVNYEKKLLFVSNRFLLNASAEAGLGTVNDKIGAGFNIMRGQFNDPYHQAVIKKTKITYYIYGQGRISFIGYDATLQGGLFNRKSPYTIPSDAITRISFQADAGLVLHFRKIYLSYSQAYLTKEFRSGSDHRWGGISIGFSL